MFKSAQTFSSWFKSAGWLKQIGMHLGLFNTWTLSIILYLEENIIFGSNMFPSLDVGDRGPSFSFFQNNYCSQLKKTTNVTVVFE
jgi:hypothetical protein